MQIAGGAVGGGLAGLVAPAGAAGTSGQAAQGTSSHTADAAAAFAALLAGAVARVAPSSAAVPRGPSDATAAPTPEQPTDAAAAFPTLLAAPGTPLFDALLPAALPAARDEGEVHGFEPSDERDAPVDETANTLTAAGLPGAAVMPNAAPNAPAASSATVTRAARDVRALAPALRERLGRVVDRMRDEFGHTVAVAEAGRTQARQDYLYAQGRTRPGPVVTWTRHSEHTLGRAVDVTIDGGYDDAAAFRLLQRVAREEGLATLGARDPGHLQLPRDVAGEGWVPAESLLRAAMPAALPLGVRVESMGTAWEHGPAASVPAAAPGGVAQVAAVAAVASVAPVAAVAAVAAPAVPGVAASTTAAQTAPARRPSSYGLTDAARERAAPAERADAGTPSVAHRAPTAHAAHLAAHAAGQATAHTDATRVEPATPRAADGDLTTADADAPVARFGNVAADTAAARSAAARAGAQRDHARDHTSRDGNDRRSDDAPQDSATAVGEASFAAAAERPAGAATDTAVGGTAAPHRATASAAPTPTAAPAPALGAVAAQRVADVIAAQEAGAPRQVSHLTLRVDNAAGGEDRIRIDLRRSLDAADLSARVDARIDVADFGSADRLAANTGELRDALARHGLSAEAVQVSAGGARGGGDGNPGGSGSSSQEQAREWTREHARDGSRDGSRGESRGQQEQRARHEAGGHPAADRRPRRRPASPNA